MSNNFDSLRSKPDMSAPMTPCEMERELTHLFAKVRELETKVKALEHGKPSSRVVAAMISRATEHRNGHQPQSTDFIQSMIDTANEDQLIVVAELIQQAVEKAAKDLPSREPRLSQVIIKQISDQCRRRMASFRATWSHRYRALEERVRKLES